jgi:hypothetical protein
MVASTPASAPACTAPTEAPVNSSLGARRFGGCIDELDGHLGENLDHELAAPGVVVAERTWLGEALEGDDARGERLPGGSDGVDVADVVIRWSRAPEASGLAGAIDAGLVLVEILANMAATSGHRSTRA